MTEPKKKILNLVERAATFQAQGKYAAAIDCLIQGLGIMAETIEDPKPEINSSRETCNLEESIANESFKRNLSDIDAMVIWNLGLAAWDASKKWGAKFPHE